MARDFNGSNQWLSTASAPVNATPFTIACWFNPDVAPQPGNGGCIALQGAGTGTFSRFMLYFNTSSKCAAVTINSTNTDGTAISTSSYTAGSWQHACGVWTSSTSRSIYYNGTNEATNTTNITPTAGDVTNLYIGRQLFGITYFDGKMAEVGIWNTDLTAAEIASLAKGMTCDKVRPQNLVFYAPLVRDLIDQKGGLTITNNNGATVANHPRVYA